MTPMPISQPASQRSDNGIPLAGTLGAGWLTGSRIQGQALIGCHPTHDPDASQGKKSMHRRGGGLACDRRMSYLHWVL